jgi:hypothetical protein
MDVDHVPRASPWVDHISRSHPIESLCFMEKKHVKAPFSMRSLSQNFIPQLYGLHKGYIWVILFQLTVA